jgi:hypothetical protein
MRIIPLCFCPTLSEEEIYRHECSDRIWVPRHTFERWLTAEDAGSVVIVRLDGVPACMYAPHSGPRNIIYAPMWICEELGVSLDPPEEDEGDDYIVPERLHPSMCTFMKVQPHTSEHLPSCVGGTGGDAMPEDTLSRAFEEYTCLRNNQTVMLHLPSGNRMFVTITEALTTEGEATGPMCVRNTEIAMDLLEPLDRIRPPTPPPAPPALLFPEELPQEPEQPKQPQEPEQPQETREERRERMYRAVMARKALTENSTEESTT